MDVPLAAGIDAHIAGVLGRGRKAQALPVHPAIGGTVHSVELPAAHHRHIHNVVPGAGVQGDLGVAGGVQTDDRSVLARGDVGPELTETIAAVDAAVGTDYRAVKEPESGWIGLHRRHRAAGQSARSVPRKILKCLSRIAAAVQARLRAGVHRDEDRLAQDGQTADVALRERHRAQRCPRLAPIGGSKQARPRPAERGERTESTHPGDQRLIRKIEQVELKRADRERRCIVRQRHPVGAWAERVGGLPDTAVHGAGVHHLGVHRVRRGDAHRPCRRVALGTHPLDLPVERRAGAKTLPGLGHARRYADPRQHHPRTDAPPRAPHV